MLKYIDDYTVKARVAPFFLALLPALFVLYLWAPKAYEIKIGIGTAILSITISLISAQVGRNSGKRKEVELWKSWGGAPTTRLLRHSNIEFNSLQRTRNHKKLQLMIPDIKIPTFEEEQNNPKLADETYEACVKYLISKTRDADKYPLIYKENVNYGFLRNLWGLKNFGISISILSIILSCLYIGINWFKALYISPESIIVLLLCVVALLSWIFWIKPDKVRIAAEAYAERLLECCETIE
ncbi:hypothetical protein [Pelotomaculum propionicicum]|uniref:Uncharacterized protein n=1 Tax=Pelotomaculum propionicicum TaxID=258475 RepID=A0A4Y7RPP0_9FIRM|nr:hypothetical protein [Pelotomaculum propionicicum]NLI13806.1 hypothetical protein [Peptococcaceae bacterium]TEB10247.1 hypothetical protein Pmgp_02547 [Pelotomaculum propionicicum]